MGKQQSLAMGLVIVGLVVAACGPTPQVGSFTSTGSMIADRDSQTATLLQDGRVLIVGGQDSSDNYLASAELYDPNTQAPSVVPARWRQPGSTTPQPCCRTAGFL